MTDNGTLADLKSKVLHRSANFQKLTELEQINLENEWTVFLQNLVYYGNKHYFSLCLEMIIDDDNIGGH